MGGIAYSNNPLIWSLLTLGQILLIVVIVLITVAFVILADRKIWAAVQWRKGPNVVGPFGLLQSFADLLKFVLKELVIPSGADKFVFLLAPVISVVFSFAAWAVMPFAPGWVISNLNVGVLYLLAISSLGVYGIICLLYTSRSNGGRLVSARNEMKNITDMGNMTTMVGRAKACQCQNPPFCCSTMVLRFIEPDSRITVIRMKPMETS